MQNEITQELLLKFRAPAFPGSYFISFEGIEGAGKSTQITEAKNFLESKGFRVIVIREPGGTTFGEKLRQAILSSNQEIHPLAEAYLFASSRTQLLQEVILNELAIAGTVVICDRYIDSSLAYQGHSRELGVANVLQMHSIFPLTLVPHRTFYLRIGAKTSNVRQKIRNAPKDYFESKGEDFYQKLVTGYDLAAELFPERIQVINAERDLKQIGTDIEQSLLELIGIAK